jgi:hypothetical protein
MVLGTRSSLFQTLDMSLDLELQGYRPIYKFGERSFGLSNFFQCLDPKAALFHLTLHVLRLTRRMKRQESWSPMRGSALGG